MRSADSRNDEDGLSLRWDDFQRAYTVREERSAATRDVPRDVMEYIRFLEGLGPLPPDPHATRPVDKKFEL